MKRGFRQTRPLSLASEKVTVDVHVRLVLACT
jgi:hypothetical protein